MRALASLLTVLLLVAACAINPSGRDLDAAGPQLENGCLIDAAHAEQALAGTGAEAQILGIDYTGPDGVRRGHAMLRYFWPPRGQKVEWTRTYLYDRDNSSTPLPTSVNGDDPVACARWIMPATINRAWWLDPQSPPSVAP